MAIPIPALLKSPRLLGAAAVALILSAMVVHHRLIVGERNELRQANTVLEISLDIARQNQGVLRDALANERRAFTAAVQERDAARQTLDRFREARRDDPGATHWAAQPIPDGEQERLCQALPSMAGCPALSTRE